MTTKNTRPKFLRAYSAECYFLCPNTGEIGYSIHFPVVPAVSKAEAAKIISAMPHFDCFICEDFLKFNPTN